MKILIISSAENAENKATNDSFVDKLNLKLAGEAHIEWHNYRDIGLEMDSETFRAFIISTNAELKDFDLVYFKSVFRYREQATAIVEYLTLNAVNYVGKELQFYIASYKLTQMARLSRAGLPIPKTIYLPNEHYLSRYSELQTKLGKDFIFKAVEGSTGDDNYLVTSKEQFKTILAAHAKDAFIAQSFVPNDSDLRVLIVGNQPKLIIERRRVDDTSHLNNTSQGAAAKLIPLESISQSVLKLALDAHNIMNREISGVDIMLESTTGQPYVLEVNASPQIASGAFEDEKLEIYSEYFKSALKATPIKQHVGQAEQIMLPEMYSSPIPARIDTGARTSAIWASNIKENDGKLSFTLFDKGNKLYTGKLIDTDNFSNITVTNSTGYSEERYTVKMLVRVGGRNIRATFTLANRSAQVYPVLIGRNVLRGKFVVDVKLGKQHRKQAK